MRFMFLVKSAENQGNPPQALFDAMGKFIEQGFKSGALIDTGGLAPEAMATQVRIADGYVTVTDGPFSETKEVVGGYAIMQFNSKDEAIAAAKDFLELHRTNWPEWKGASEVRQIFGPND